MLWLFLLLFYFIVLELLILIDNCLIELSYRQFNRLYFRPQYILHPVLIQKSFMRLLLGAGECFNVIIDFPPLFLAPIVVVQFKNGVSFLIGELPVAVFVLFGGG